MFNLTQTALALLEGMGLAFSPCILPILPLILAASSTGNRWRPIQIVGGFILSFTLLSLVSRKLLAITGIQLDQIQFFAFSLLLIFGLIMLIPKLEEKFALITGSIAGRAQQASQSKHTQRFGGGLLIGALIGVVWTPCAGPILAVALLQVIQSQTDLDAVTTLLAFSLGAGIPMVIIGYFGQTLTHHIKALSRHASRIRRGMGVIIIVFAAFGLYGFNLGEWVVNRSEASESVTTNQHRLINELTSPYPAPAITGIDHWLNSQPLTEQSLKGKVVLVDFWTYSCINCIRTLPSIKSWYAKYKDAGLVVIGVHSPEFSFESQLDNVQHAVQKFGITYPVALDNNFSTWNNFANRYWPAHYLIDRNGMVVYTHFGEGDYEITENNIRYLLGLNPTQAGSTDLSYESANQTPETYLGAARAENQSTTDAADLPLHHWSLKGKWQVTGQYIENTDTGAELALHYQAGKVYLVMESADKASKSITVIQNGHKKNIIVQHSQLYELMNNEGIQNETLIIHTNEPGLRLYAFTFGS